MTKRRETPRRQGDRRPTVGGNVLWSLVAAGAASLFALSLLGTSPDLELSYSDLERLVVAADAPAGEQWVTVERAGVSGRTEATYGQLHDVVIGAFQVSGKVHEPQAGQGATAAREPGVKSGQPSVRHGTSGAARTASRKVACSTRPSGVAASTATRGMRGFMRQSNSYGRRPVRAATVGRKLRAAGSAP